MNSFVYLLLTFLILLVNLCTEARGKLQVSLRMLKVHRNFKTLRTLLSTSWHLTSTMLRCFEIVVGRSTLNLPSISTSYSELCNEMKHSLFKNNQQCNYSDRQQLFINKVCTSQNSSSVSSSRTGECSRIQANGVKSSGIHQHSLRNRVFNLLNVGHSLKSILKINWTNCKQIRRNDLK